LVCSQCFFGPLGMLFIMKTLKDEWYTVMINSVIRATVHLCSFAESMYRLENTMLAMCTISRYYQRYVEDNKPLGLREYYAHKNHQLCYAFVLKLCCYFDQLCFIFSPKIFQQFAKGCNIL